MKGSAMKYVMFCDSVGKLCPVVFDDRLIHQDVVNALVPATFDEWTPVSAGKVRIMSPNMNSNRDIVGSAGGIEVFGGSASLQLTSQPEDARRIMTLLQQE